MFPPLAFELRLLRLFFEFEVASEIM